MPKFNDCDLVFNLVIVLDLWLRNILYFHQCMR